MVDSGATGIFMHPAFAASSAATIIEKAEPREVRVIDGRVINTGLVTHEATFQLVIGNHTETLTADITNTGRYDCIVGTPWLWRHDPNIRWTTGVVQFTSAFCQAHCSPQAKISNKPPASSHREINRHSLISQPTFRQTTKGAEIYMMEISELSEDKPKSKETIPIEYSDLEGAFNEEASNELPQHGPLDMKIDFKDS